MLGASSDFGEYLIDSGMLSKNAWSRVSEVIDEAQQGLVGTIAGLGLLSEKDLSLALARFLDTELASENDWPLDPVPIEQLNPTFLRSCHILPARDVGDELIAICADPSNNYAKSALEFAAEKPVKLKVATLREVEAAITSLYFGGQELEAEGGGLDGLADDVDRLKELATDAPVIRFVDRLIDDALSRRASDIHVEPIEGSLTIRLRVDGILQELPGPARDMTAAVVSRIKIMSGLDIAERRLPQDGRMRVRAHGKEVDFRVSTAPTNQGEAIVLRLLDKGAVKLEFDSLGFDDKIKMPFRSALRSPDGIVLVTGPTGSGKTTTLYTGLSELNVPERKILTVEDPVEYVMNGLGQVQVDTRIGRTFAATLRSFLRQDPDIIMVGEIRDEETASIAIQASLTGHLVLSTLHTNSAAAAISRLLDMGVEDYLLASTVRVVMAQRLVRTLCDTCKELDDVTPLTMKLPLANDGSQKFYKSVGCSLCNGTGYAGRRMIAELLEITPALEAAIMAHIGGSELEALARENGMRTLFEHGVAVAQTGQTSLQEVMRVTKERAE